jgi:hypothetical protein
MRSWRSVAGELVCLEGEADGSGGEVDVHPEGDGQLTDVLAVFGLGEEVAPALVGVGDEVDGDLRECVRGLFGAVVVGSRTLPITWGSVPGGHLSLP